MMSVLESEVKEGCSDSEWEKPIKVAITLLLDMSTGPSKMILAQICQETVYILNGFQTT